MKVVEIVDFVKIQRDILSLVLKFPKGVLLVGPPRDRKDSIGKSCSRRSKCSILLS